MAEKAIRITLSTGKVVLARIPTIKLQEQAMRMVGKAAADNQQLFTFLTSINLVKLCIAKVDQKEYNAQNPIDLDMDLTQNEISQINSAFQEYQGTSADFLPKIEAVSIGA